MTTILEYISQLFVHLVFFLSSSQFLLVSECTALLIKSSIVIILIYHAVRSQHSKKPWLLVITIIVANMFGDLAWVFDLVTTLFVPTIQPFSSTFTRFAWAMVIVERQAIVLFMLFFIKNKKITTWCLIPTLSVSTYFFLAFCGSSFLQLYSLIYATFPFGIMKDNLVNFYFFHEKLEPFYNLALGIPLAWTLSHIKKNTTSRILKKQLSIFIYYLVVPYYVLNSLSVWFFGRINEYTINSFIALFSAYMFYFCFKKLLRLRFLNHQHHVQAEEKFNVINHFKKFLEELGKITTINELSHLIQIFFSDSFAISIQHTSFYERQIVSAEHDKQTAKQPLSLRETWVENFLAQHGNTQEFRNYLKKTKILITDEVAFSNFYEGSTLTKTVQQFLETIHADIFIPIYEKDTICAYIVVERYARPKEFYSDVERDEMVLFSSYIGNIIHLMHNRTLVTLIEKQKDLKEELYAKHQEISTYKESIRSFLRNPVKKIGIIFYKNRQFVFGNQSAHEMVTINLNTQEGHPLTKDFKSVAKDVTYYNAPQTLNSKNNEGEPIVITGIQNLEKNNIIILVSYPEISDVVKQQVDLLKDPSDWDYLLYLETTKSGQLINQLIPGNGETLLNFKINLLKLSLSTKAVLLELPADDLPATVELIHHISLRENLHTLDLQSPEKSSEYAIQLFGINPIFGAPAQEPLLEKLNRNGTLFIKNVHHLSLETQNNVAEFIRYGFYHVFKSDQTMHSNVRIIVSSEQDLASLTQEGKFSKALYQEIKKSTLVMPSLLTLAKKEIESLAHGFSQQAISTQAYENLLELSEHDTNKLCAKGTVSLQELKDMTRSFLVQKSKKHNIYDEVTFDPSYYVSDPELVEAARLGKQALRDQKIMLLLWNKFKNQNKMATFLGVNRSSIHRRCKEYNIF